MLLDGSSVVLILQFGTCHCVHCAIMVGDSALFSWSGSFVNQYQWMHIHPR